MDTRKLKADLEVTLHNEGRPEQWTEVVVDGGHPTMGYFDPPQAAELVRRWNAYPELVALAERVLGHIQSAIDEDDDDYLLDLKTCDECGPDAIRELLETLKA